jgi:hypothetical protein
MSLTTPEGIRRLQRKLYLKAKAERRHQVPTHGTHRFPADTVFGELGVLRLRRVHLGPPPCALG